MVFLSGIHCTLVSQNFDHHHRDDDDDDVGSVLSHGMQQHGLSHALVIRPPRPKNACAASGIYFSSGFQD